LEVLDIRKEIHKSRMCKSPPVGTQSRFERVFCMVYETELT
jgi:hypothetical protein